MKLLVYLTLLTDLNKGLQSTQNNTGSFEPLTYDLVGSI